MWETIRKLRYRANAGIADAVAELDVRMNDRLKLPLTGIYGESLYLTGYSRLAEKANAVNALYAGLPERRGFRNVVLLDAWSSATIEGARTTVARVKASLSDPQTKDDRMVVNTMKATDYAFKNAVTGKNIRRLWEKVVDGVCENEEHRGVLYRDGMVYIGSAERIIHTPAAPAQLPKLMADWFAYREQETSEVLLSSFAAHFYFVYIHPFCDGNGRLARLLNIARLYQTGYKKIRGISLSNAINEQLSGYYAGLSESEVVYDGGGEHWLDLSPFVSYMLDAFERSIIDAALSPDRLTQQETAILERMNKVGPKAEITVQKAAKILAVSESRTRAILRSLVSKGYLDVDASRSPYIYRLHPHIPA